MLIWVMLQWRRPMGPEIVGPSRARQYVPPSLNTCIKALSPLGNPLGTKLFPRVPDFPDQRETKYAYAIPSAERQLVYEKKSGEKIQGKGTQSVVKVITAVKSLECQGVRFSTSRDQSGLKQKKTPYTAVKTNPSSNTY